MASFLSSKFSSYVLVLVFFFTSFNGYSSNVAGEEVMKYHSFSLHSLLPEAVCTPSSSEESNPNSLTVVHRHGPCSPFKHGRRKPNHHEILSGDRLRLAWLNRRTSAASGQDKLLRDSAATTTVTVSAQGGYSLGTSNFIVTVGFGTPPQPQKVVFDTGSDLSWIQCKPCTNGCNQDQPLYDPSRSSTYAKISCRSPDCSQFLDEGKPSCSPYSVCRYSVNYADNSTSSGVFSEDTLTMPPSDAVPNFRFGCGDMTSGIAGHADGLLGLGRDKASLISQASEYGKVFSYCLPPKPSSTGYLKLGGGAPANVKFTPMLTRPNYPTFYFLQLVSISVGGKKLPVPPTVFSSVDTIIDSGTVVTYLPAAAYASLRDTFKMLMVYPTAPALDILDTCYNFTGYDPEKVKVKVPAVGLEFGGGVTLDVDFSGILYTESYSQACLAFAPNMKADDLTVVGNVQQKTFSVVYDVANQKIGFGKNGCK